MNSSSPRRRSEDQPMPLPRIAVSDATFQANSSSEAGGEGEPVMLPAGVPSRGRRGRGPVMLPAGCSLRDRQGRGPVMLPAGCSQQRQPGETLGRSAVGAGAAVGGGHASFPLGKPGILSIPRRRDPCHRHTSLPQLREDESPAHNFCSLSATGSTELSESPYTAAESQSWL